MSDIEPHENDWGLLSPEQVAERKKLIFTTNIIPNHPERKATLAQREKAFHERLKGFDPASRRELQAAFQFGQEVVIVGALPEFKDYEVALINVGQALQYIAAAIMCNNGPETRAVLKKGLGDLMGALEVLDTTIQQINRNPKSSLWVDEKNLQINDIQEIRLRTKDFLNSGGTDQKLDELRTWLAQFGSIDTALLLTISARREVKGRRGRTPDDVLDRIADCVYETSKRRQAGQTNGDIARIAIAKLKAHGDPEAATRYEQRDEGKKRNDFTAQMIKRGEARNGTK